MKNLHELQMQAMMEVINTCVDEVIAETWDVTNLSELDKDCYKTIALTELMEIILENYFELFYENKKLRRKLREKTNSKTAL